MVRRLCARPQATSRATRMTCGAISMPTREAIQNLVTALPDGFVLLLLAGMLYLVLWSAQRARDRWNIAPILIALGLMALFIVGLCLCAFLTMALWD